MNVLYRIENDDSYSYILNIFGWSTKPSQMLSDVHLGSNKLMLAMYKHNSVVFNATVFYPSYVKIVRQIHGHMTNTHS